MLRSIRYHLDHDVNHNTAIADALRRLGIDVTVSEEVGTSREPDEGQLDFARQQGRVLVTHDADFLRLGVQEANHAGIIHAPQRGLAIRDVVNGLVLIWECNTPEEMQGAIIFLNRGLIKGL